jgi:hypothetical protein
MLTAGALEVQVKLLAATLTILSVAAPGPAAERLPYAGLTLSDAKYEPYLALAEELDIPVAVHTGTGPPAPPSTPTSRRWSAPASGSS